MPGVARPLLLAVAMLGLVGLLERLRWTRRQSPLVARSSVPASIEVPDEHPQGDPYPVSLLAARSR